MSSLESYKEAYDLEKAMVTDMTSNCIIINVGQGNAHSLKIIDTETRKWLADARRLTTAKLYVVGDFHGEKDKGHGASEASDEWTVLGLSEQSDVTELELTLRNQQTSAAEQDKWHAGVGMICKLIRALPNLKEMTWVSTLPFMEAVWGVVPLRLTKLIIDLGQPIRIGYANAITEEDRKSPVYNKQIDMDPLTNMMNLEELRLFNMYHSLQYLVWITAYRKKPFNLIKVVELTMLDEPSVRNIDHVMGPDVKGLKAITEHSATYKGTGGMGCLHWRFGFGEYLDNFCMRKARIAAHLDKAQPIPILCLKLDGFAIDELPFKEELAGTQLLILGENCIDTGFRPSTSKVAVQWPKWAKTFNDAN